MKKLIIALGIAVFTWNVFGIDAFAYEQLPLGDGSSYDEILTDNIVSGAIDGNSSQESLKVILSNNFVSLFNFVIGSIAILYLVITGVKMIFSRGSADQEEKYKNEFLWIVIGLIVVSAAEFVAFDIFDPSGEGDANIISGDGSVKKLTLLANEIKRYFEYIVMGFILMQGAITGYNLVTGGTEDDTLENEKKFIQSAGFGMGLILFAELLVAIFSLQGGTGDSAGAANEIITQVVGIINFLLTMFGIIAVFTLVWAAVYYLTSFGNEDQMNRAKKMIIVAVVGLIIIISSYTFMTFFFGSPSGSAFLFNTSFV